ncbi:MAG: hypothetical protein N3A68_07195 [Bacteroidia bacterium]|nr:hypothetical protein [Bacteroidia bacterium]
MRYPTYWAILSLLGNAVWAQATVQLEEPQQAWVFHVEGTERVPFQEVVQTLQRAFPMLERVLPCEKGHYLVLIPRAVLPPKDYQAFRQAVEEALTERGWRPYFKEGASVVELAHNCEELLKPLLKP